MEPGVPFALLGTVALLATAAWTALAGAGLVRAARRGGGQGPALLLTVGGVVLIFADVSTALRFGVASSDELALVRAGGALLLASALALGALRDSTTDKVAVPPQLGGLGGLVVPLAAAPVPSALAGVAGLAAALAAVRFGRRWPELLLGAGLLATGVASLLGPRGDDGPDPAALVLSLRGAGALLILGGLVGLTRSSLLAKVVAAILAGILVMAAAAVGVVGTVVVRAYDRQASSLVEQAAQGRLQTLENTLELAKASTTLAQGVCARGRTLCDTFLRTTDTTHLTFAASVVAGRGATSLGGSLPLSATELLALSASCPVRVVLSNTCRPAPTPVRALPTYVRLAGTAPSVAAIVVQAVGAPTPTARPASVFVYGVRIDSKYAENDFVDGGYGFHLIALGQIVASNRSLDEQRQVLLIDQRREVERGVPLDVGLTVPAEGSSPTVHFRPLQGIDGTIAVLAISRDASASTAAQQDALRALLLTALAATGLAAVFAVALGRRTVDPVRRLTAAAERVRAGDLTASAAVSSSDEVGTLSRTFDAMTGSLAQLTDDLRDSASRLQTVLMSMSDGLVATDGAGRVTSINPAALAMVGLRSDADALGRPMGEVVQLMDATGAAMPTDGRRLYDAPAEVSGVHGTPVPVRAALTPLAGGEGVVLLLRDTTREREVERMKTEFLSNVSHELRTPLTPIRGYADLLATRPGLTSAQVGAFASTILLESLKMNRVVDLLVDVAALEAGRLTVEPRPVRVADVVDLRLAAWRARAPERAGDLRRDVSPDLPDVHVDPTWVGKALDELIDNALKYSQPGATVTIGASLRPDVDQDGGRVRVYVRDDGPGIPEDKQGSLFTSFEQVDGSETRKVGGLGLGLSFVRRLAQDAGWPMAVMSIAGAGSEFGLDLPASSGVAPPVAQAGNAAGPVAQPEATLRMEATRKAQLKKALLAEALAEAPTERPAGDGETG